MDNKRFNEYEIKGNITEIYIKQRNSKIHIVLIDTENLSKLINFGHRWHVQLNNHTNSYYAHATIYNKNSKLRNITMQSFLFKCRTHEIPDHINNNGLDNRKDNIRICLNKQNLKNRKSKNSNNTSGHRNVTWMSGRWRVQLQINGKNHLFKEKFDDVNKAGKFAEEMRSKFYGKFAGKS